MAVRIAGEGDETMEDGDPRKGISLHSRWLVAVGEAAQQGAKVEWQMDFLYQRLSGRKLHAETIREIAKGTFEVPQPRFQKALPPVGAVAKKCLALLPEVYEDAKEEAEARRVISDAQEALEGRNRMVHDRWLGVEDDPASVIRLRRTPGGQHGDRLVGATQEPSSLVVFEQTVIDLARVAIRISALLGTIDEEWDLPGSPFTRAKSWEVARGEFELLGTEAYVPHSRTEQ